MHHDPALIASVLHHLDIVMARRPQATATPAAAVEPPVTPRPAPVIAPPSAVDIAFEKVKAAALARQPASGHRADRSGPLSILHALPGALKTLHPAKAVL